LLVVRVQPGRRRGLGRRTVGLRARGRGLGALLALLLLLLTLRRLLRVLLAPRRRRAGRFRLLLFGIRHVPYFAFTRGIGWPDLTAIRSAVPSLSRRRRTRVGSPDLGSSNITFDAASGAGSSMMPLSSFGVAARLCFFTMFTPSTTTRNSLGWTCNTLPSFPRCSPEITRTVSPLAICILWRSGSRGPVLRRLFLKTSGFMSNHLGRERHDFHEPLLAQLPPHRSEDAGRAGLPLIGNQHRGVFVEPDVGAVLALRLLGRPHDHRSHHLALLDLAGGNRVLDRDHDDVAQARVASLGPAEHANDERAPRARVVRDLEYRLLLHHGPPPPPLLRALDDFDHAPALGLRQRAGLHDAYRVARLRVGVVVGRDLL